LATEIDLGLLGAHAEALLWINVQPGALDTTAETLKSGSSPRRPARPTS
jgi:hypothetical protein